MYFRTKGNFLFNYLKQSFNHRSTTVMHRRHFLRSSALTLGALTLLNRSGLAGLAQQPWKITMLTDDLGVFTERGGTIAFLLRKDGIIVVDSQFPEQSDHLIGELRNRSEKPIRLLINTHHHGDHTGGNIAFKGIVENVLAHANSRANQERVAIESKTTDRQFYPTQTFTDTWCERLGKDNVCLYYFGAGHTNGDSFVHFERANAVHCGDLVFNRRHPYVDRPGGANIKSWMQVLDKGIARFGEKATYIFGHSANGYDITGKADDLRAFRDYLGQVLKFVEGEMKAGKTKEEILKATAIPGADQWKGDGIQRPLTAAWEELGGK